MNAIGKSWRDSASLMVVARRVAKTESVITVKNNDCVNYDVLLQTRTRSASYPNSVVFPGGVYDRTDDADHWLAHFKSFGYTNQDFEAFHCPGTITTPLFQNNPIQRHISLRITAIRETFEELGLLLCRTSKEPASDCASVISDLDVIDWQKRVSKEPTELLTLCKEYNCYPDIWSLHYWSNWLSPIHLPKRFSTAFFVAAIADRAAGFRRSKSEVTNVEWIDPVEILHNNNFVIYPPQFYELHRLTQISNIEKLIQFAKERSWHGEELVYPVRLRAKDGDIHLFPGDELYPSSVDYDNKSFKTSDKTLEELRNQSRTTHRLEVTKPPQFVIKNYKSKNHINMGDGVIPANVAIN